jgi:phosphoribosyl 1,2-cyclic phosphate phosphodiesterase
MAHKYPGVPSFRLKDINDEPFYISGLKVTPISVNHGKLPIYGYRIGSFAYITDASYISEESMELLKGLDLLIINGLRHKPHFAHFTVKEALKVIDELKPRQAYITHICHDLGLHAEEDAKLPANVGLAYDGLVASIS